MIPLLIQTILLILILIILMLFLTLDICSLREHIELSKQQQIFFTTQELERTSVIWSASHWKGTEQEKNMTANSHAPET